MTPTLPQRQHLKNKILLPRFVDWAGVQKALDQKGCSLAQSTLDRFIKGTSQSRRTLHSLAKILETTPANLLRDLDLIAASPINSAVKDASGSPADSLLRDPEAFRVAYQLWVEMGTRKLGEPIDPATDLVNEIYDSWYAFFKTARELAKAIPLHKDPADPALRRLVQLSQAVLNHGLRPHLQRWQGKFRRWQTTGDRALAPGLSPQQAQALFPEWSALHEDLLATSHRLMTYHAVLAEMVAQPNVPLPPATTTGKKPRSTRQPTRR